MERKWGRGDPRAPERPLALEERFHCGGGEAQEAGGHPKLLLRGQKMVMSATPDPHLEGEMMPQTGRVVSSQPV